MRPAVPRGTRERILRVAEGFFGDRGYHGTRLHHIADSVGIQKASLFHYFPSKEDLYRAVLAEDVGAGEQMIRRVLAAGGTRAEKVHALVEAYVDMVAMHPARAKILLRQSLGDAPPGPHSSESERVLAPVVAFIEEGQHARVFTRVDPMAFVLGVMGMVVFFLTSAPIVAPGWPNSGPGTTRVEHVKHHVAQVVERCLGIGARRPAVAVAGVGA